MQEKATYSIISNRASVKKGHVKQLIEFVANLAKTMQSGYQMYVLIIDCSKALDKVSKTGL